MKPAGRIWRLGAFEIVKDLAAKGAQGKLYVGRALEAAFPGLLPGDLVALKVMPDHGDDAERDFKRLVRRTNALIAAANPGIVRYYGCFASSQGFEDVHVLVMELLRGQTLEERLKSNKLGLDADEVLRIIRSCADALVRVAEHGLVHRDIKPSNIFLCDDGTAKLIDFEIARQDGASRTTTESGAMRGTVDYMAPDFHPDFRPDRGFRGDECSDVFSLTVCLYEMLAGSRPYSAGGAMGEQSMMAFFQRWTKVEGVDVSKALKIESFRIHALAHVQRIIKKGLSPERAGRYQTYREFAEALQGVALREIASPSARYELLRCVGKGGFGVVFRGRRKEDGLIVAIKALLKPEYAERFVREAKTLSRFSDDRLVSYVEYFRTIRATSETHFIVMQFLEGMPGSSLRDRIATAAEKRLPLSAREIATAFLRFAGGLGIMHRAGIVHRDIKPANLYFPAGAPERACVMDLGVVKTEETHTQGSLPGTLDYMAPEMALGTSRGSPAVDIFALGLCLHEALTGQPAYPRLKRGGDGLAEFYRRAKDGVKPDLTRLDSRPSWRSLVASMTDPDPKRRIQDCDEVIRLLSRIPEGELADPDAARRRGKAADGTGPFVAALGREVGLPDGSTTIDRDSSDLEPVAKPSDPVRGNAKKRSRIELPIKAAPDAPVAFPDGETRAGAETRIAGPEGETRADGAGTRVGAETRIAGPEGETRADGGETRVGAETRIAGPEGETRVDGAGTRVGAETRIAGPEGETRVDGAGTRVGAETRIAGPEGETRAAGAGTRATVATAAFSGTVADLTKTRATIATPDNDKEPEPRVPPKPKLKLEPQPTPQLPKPKPEPEPQPQHSVKPQPTQPHKPKAKPEQTVVVRRTTARPWQAALFIIALGAAFGVVFYLKQKAEERDKKILEIENPDSPVAIAEKKLNAAMAKQEAITNELCTAIAAAKDLTAMSKRVAAITSAMDAALSEAAMTPGVADGAAHRDAGAKREEVAKALGFALAARVAELGKLDAIAEAEKALNETMEKQDAAAIALRDAIAKAADLAESRKSASAIKSAMDAALATAAETEGVKGGEAYGDAGAKRGDIARALDDALAARATELGKLDAIAEAEKALKETIEKQEVAAAALEKAIAKADDLAESRKSVAAITNEMDAALAAAVKTEGVVDGTAYRDASAKRGDIARALDDALNSRQKILDGISAVVVAEEALGKAMAKQEAAATALHGDIDKANDLAESRKTAAAIKGEMDSALDTAAQTEGVKGGAAYRAADEKRGKIAKALDGAIAAREAELVKSHAIAEAEKALNETMEKQEAAAIALRDAIAKAADLAESRKSASAIKSAMDAALATAAETEGVKGGTAYSAAVAKRTTIATTLDNAITARAAELGKLDAIAKAEETLAEAIASQKSAADSLRGDIAIAKADDLTAMSNRAAAIKSAMAVALATAAETEGVKGGAAYSAADEKRTIIATTLDNAITARAAELDAIAKAEKARRKAAEENVRSVSEALSKLKGRVGRISDRRSYDEAAQEAKTLAIPAETGYADLDENLGKLRATLTQIKQSLDKKASAEVKNTSGVPIIVSVGNAQKRIAADGRVEFSDLAVWSAADVSAKAEGDASADYEAAKKTVELKGGGSRASIDFNLEYKGDPEVVISNANDVEVKAAVDGKTLRVPAKGFASFTGKPRETTVVTYSCDEAHEIRDGAEARIQLGDAGTSRPANAPVLMTRPRRIAIVDPLGGNVTWHVRAQPEGKDLGQLGAGHGGSWITIDIPADASTIYLVPDPPRLKDGKKQSLMKAEYETIAYDVSKVSHGETKRWEPKARTNQANRLANIGELKSRGINYWFWTAPDSAAYDATPEVVDAEYGILAGRIKTALQFDPDDATNLAATWGAAASPMARLEDDRYKICRARDKERVDGWRRNFDKCRKMMGEGKFVGNEGYDDLKKWIGKIKAPGTE